MARLLTPDPVTIELRRWATEPFAWCALSVLDYVERVERRRLRPRPRLSRFTALRVARTPERFAALCHDAMSRLGMRSTVAPIRGDVGLVHLTAGLTAAICVGGAGAGLPMWAARGDRSVVIQAARPVQAWRVACRRP